MPEINGLIHAISIGILLNGILLNLFYLIEIVISFFALKNRPVTATSEEMWWLTNETTIPISILMPVFNEQECVVEAVKSMLAMHYPVFEVIVINDGSKDETLSTLIREFDLFGTNEARERILPYAEIRGFYHSRKYSSLMVIDKVNGGKADAINAGIELSRNSLLCVIDGDSILEADSLLRAVQPFADNPESVIAVGGSIRVANGSLIQNGRVRKPGLPKNLWALFQIVEYMSSFLIARLALSAIKSTVLISGAFGIYKRSALLEIGGFSKNTVIEDMDVIMKMHYYFRNKNQKYEIIFTPEPVCWTECPTDLRSLRAQRSRWQQGALQVFFKFRRMFARPQFGRMGFIGYPYMLVTDIAGPLIEFLGFFLIPLAWFLGYLNIHFMLAFLSVTVTFGIFFSIGSLILSEMELKNYEKPSELLILFIAAIVENFGYRQLNNYWRLLGWKKFLRSKNDWGSIKRRGFSNSR